MARGSYRLSVFPCQQYEVEVSALLTTSESAEADSAQFMAKKQPELAEDAANSVHIVYGTLSVSRKREITDVTRVVVKGGFDDLLIDRECKSIKKSFILYKTEDKEEWHKKEIEINDPNFEEEIFLPDYCKMYSFKLLFEGYPGSSLVSLNLENKIGPADLEQTGLERVPSVTNIRVLPRVDTALISWRQPDCVPAYEFVVYLLEDCLNEEEFEDCFNDAMKAEDPSAFSLDHVVSGSHDYEYRFKQELDSLDSCTEYLLLVRTVNNYGRGEVVSKTFRTRDTDHEFDGETDKNDMIDVSTIPSITHLKVLPKDYSATLDWRQPECFPDYELQLIKLEECEEENYIKCLEQFSPSIEGLAEKKTNSYDFTELEPCTEYVAMARTVGKKENVITTAVIILPLQ